MRKLPVGYFIDPTTKETVVILARNKESAEAAKERVSKAHSVPPDQIVDKMPEGAGANPGIIIDLPDRPAVDDSKKRFARREEVDPLGALSRYNERADKAAPGQAGPSIASQLTGNTDPFLGPKPPPHARSTPETETKK